MRLPNDWDKPSEGNDKLCELFTYETYDDGEHKLPYRLFTPNHNKGRVPLVVYLHGADVFGDDNNAHLAIHDIGTMFARSEWQAMHPCYILAPFCSAASGHTAYFLVADLICELLSKLMAEHEDIDTSRLYIYGYSAGGARTFRILKEHPGVFAGAVVICGATDPMNMERIADIPIRLFHAEDDTVVRTTFRLRDGAEPIYYGSKDLYDTLGENAVDMDYTEYPAGYMNERYGVNPHCSWVAVSEDEASKEWLFEQKMV